MKIRVKQHKELGDTGFIDHVGLVYQNDDVIILNIDLNRKGKYKEVSAYGGATDEDYQSIWIGFDEIQMSLPERFSHNQIFASTSRYTLSVCIYRFELLERFSDSSYDEVILWEADHGEDD